MSSAPRGEFTSSFGFVMAAAGCAVGLANIWGFPTQAAQNGGAAFVLIYIILTFLVGYPVLMAEFTIGRYARASAPEAYKMMGGGRTFEIVGLLGIFTVGCILSFYAIIGGGMIAFFIEPLTRMANMVEVSDWMVAQSVGSNFIFSSLFFLATILIVAGGVQNGIEKWSSRFMPTLFVIMILLVGYVLTLDGALEGLAVYLLPDFSKVLDHRLITSALGQSFFSLSLGVGGMLVYGSYTSKRGNLVKLGLQVTFTDFGVAFLAGMLIIPTMYAAAASGMQIFDASGNLISGPNLIFQILPELFSTMGPVGSVVAVLFFFLMSIAALTSSIGMLEVPVSYFTDKVGAGRMKSAWLIGLFFWGISMLIVFNYQALFGLFVTIATVYSQPLLGLGIAIFAGWVVHRDVMLNELKEGYPEVADSFFYRFWPVFLRFVCPLLILFIFLQQFIYS